MRKLIALIATIAAVAVAPFAGAAVTGTAKIAPPWQNCKQVNKHWPHGVGLPKARDKTSGTRVTNFTRSTRLYLMAIGYNRTLDGDKDRIACEKR